MTAFSGGHDLAISLTDHLQSQSQKSIHRVTKITATADEVGIVLHGETSSFYYKQLAQEIAKAFLKNCISVQNKIVVRREMEIQPVDDPEH